MGELLDPRVDPGEVDADAVGRASPSRSVRSTPSSVAPGHLGHQLGGRDQGLAGHAVGEHRRAAQAVGVDDGDLGAELRGDQPRLVPARPAADDDDAGGGGGHARHCCKPAAGPEVGTARRTPPGVPEAPVPAAAEGEPARCDVPVPPAGALEVDDARAVLGAAPPGRLAPEDDEPRHRRHPRQPTVGQPVPNAEDCGGHRRERRLGCDGPGLLLPGGRRVERPVTREPGDVETDRAHLRQPVLVHGWSSGHLPHLGLVVQRRRPRSLTGAGHARVQQQSGLLTRDAHAGEDLGARPLADEHAPDRRRPRSTALGVPPQLWTSGVIPTEHHRVLRR